MEEALQPNFTYSQLVATGLSEADIRARVRAGDLIRLRRGIYCFPEMLEPGAAHLRLARATMPLVHESNVLSHQSAACVHELPVPRALLDTVAMTRRTQAHGRGRSKLRIYASRLHGDEVTTVRGLPVTTLTRTIADLARTQPFHWAVAACDAGLAMGVGRDELLSGLARHPGLHGLPVARSAVRFADARSESPAESLSRVQFLRHGVPAPVLQFAVRDVEGQTVATSDFGWPDLRLVGEVDGKWKYGELLKPGQKPADAIMAEKRREEAIRLAGYWIVRWDWPIATNGPELARRVLRAMEFQRKQVAA
ncbi:type IV toxin-antitoxin system AbiEi family antitoxin domain-containing protein [Tessaracoccus sp. OS52]|uniref:type IV toxin-antitoxin system AbiEi family antitoxin domain-containing protein n=1 Tax=Tessaracoccus sp. OS52 TaxID=2886691 RepID=UPI001D127703|nr:type IV toxin-antitoxin system AbiEi family antitoxin domain-containing protein [Tessaracoccus sp. OS52]MCC2593174.1 type IV toxin-antitoxin system AbiEi family antitoxin domain-containing protein [Tessaracoccus sp. OS52]